ncbi:putative clathrin light chain 1-like [Capsicum annuum]|nr:putative clathrin light chain 1-like [Capsicum annuum]
MSSLLLIDLGANSFNGRVPQLPAGVTTVDFSRNKFSGNISFTCDNYDYLGYLNLSDNLFSVELPYCLNLRSLVHLNLANNNFSGEIPSSVGSSGMMMRMLQLRNNHFIGELPRSLENCKYLRFIDVGENNLTNIQILDVSQNKISGTIPKCINNLTELTKEESPKQKVTSWYYRSYIKGGVTVTRNTSYDESAFLMWKGREFEYSNTLGLVKSIDLSNNDLVGEIPVEITSLIGLLGLNLSRNNLTGSIPTRIGQLRDINFLDLSRNKLSGKIPSSFSQLSHLGVLNLSYNNLSGRIPLDTQSKTFNSSSYIGNPGLCGSPLSEACPGDELSRDPKLNADSEEKQQEDEFISAEFYISMGIGFTFGFWGVCSALILKRTWRYALFRFLENIFKNYSIFNTK